LGLAIGRRVSPMQLPQTVAALHSVVGLAAVMTSMGSVLGATSSEELNGVHLTTAYLGVLIGGITFTGRHFITWFHAIIMPPNILQLILVILQVQSLHSLN